MPVTLSNGNQMSPALLASLLGLTSAAGAFPTPSSTNSQTIGSSTSANVGNSTSDELRNEFLNNLISSINTNQTKTGQTSFSTPTLSPATQKLMDQLIGQYSDLAGKNTDERMKSILANQTQQINKTSATQGDLTNEILASRGLSTSPVAATAQLANQNSRFQQINQAQNQIPLLQQQLQLESLNPAAAFFASIPKGQVNGSDSTLENTSIGNQSTNQTGGSTNKSTVNTTAANQNNTLQGTETTGSAGGGVGGALSGLATMLAGLLGGGKSLPTGTTVSPTGTTIPGTTPGTTPPFVVGANGQTIPTTLPAGSGANNPTGFLGALAGILGNIFGVNAGGKG
jgi:hypothetical protein